MYLHDADEGTESQNQYVTQCHVVHYWRTELNPQTMSISSFHNGQWRDLGNATPTKCRTRRAPTTLNLID